MFIVLLQSLDLVDTDNFCWQILAELLYIDVLLLQISLFYDYPCYTVICVIIASGEQVITG